MEMSEIALSEFLGKFDFRDELTGYVGIEREHFLVDRHGVLVPRSKLFLETMDDERWTYELSACQVEDRTRPQKEIGAIKLELLENDNNAVMCARKLGIRVINREVQDVDMPLDVYPDPRYLEIVRNIERERLSAACRVTGTHIHIGVSDMMSAIATYNVLLPYLEELCELGDHSDGERLRLYKTMATSWKPERYKNVHDFLRVAKLRGFAENPRNCWDLIRISRHGTIELRMFGVTEHTDEVLMWVSRIKKILKGGGCYVG
ncbi:MAG: hypothetical protein HZA36_01895 [Parcubacteria group bacterium]|nr:hypothetical protein [Parcubacteria group bacterium]